jgi:RHS repeat-associated protein
MSYDASGNTLSDGSYSYTWDGESQMKTAAGVTYAYDGDGRRVAKVGSKLYWYGSGGEILSETDASGNTQNEYIFFGGKRVAMVPASGSALYYAEDSLGTSKVIVQSNGTLCYDADFVPYGGERAYTNTCAQNYKFEGKERDTETQNDDFGARYYSWRFGRWLSADWSAVPAPVPYANLANPQTLNLYSMVADDPETFADLDGHMFWAPFLGNGPIGDISFLIASGAGPSENSQGLSYFGSADPENDPNQNQSQNQNQAQNQSQTQTQQLSASDVSKGIKAFDSDKEDKNPGRVVKALDTMGKDFTVSGDTLRQGAKDSGVAFPKDADKVLANVDSITRTGNNVVITNKDSMTIKLLGQMGKTISFTINESVKGKSGYQGPALQNLKGVGIGIGPFASHPDHWGPE